MTEGPCRIILIRHAKTDYDSFGPEGRFCGRSDPPLSVEGMHQAVTVGLAIQQRYGSWVRTVITSPLKRAEDTARAVAETLGLPLVGEAALREIDYGEWDGLTKAEIKERYPVLRQKFEVNPISAVPPGGESPMEVYTRISSYYDSMRRDGLVLVGHKTSFRLLLCHVLGREPRDYRRLVDLRLASITVIDKTSLEPILLLNDRRHIDQDATPD